MSPTTERPIPGAGTAPELAFRIEGAGPLEHAAEPTMRFSLGIESVSRVPIRSIVLDVQIQIAARRRGYDAAAQERLVELFGTPERWGETLRTLLWSRPTVFVPRFEERTLVDVLVPCSYDLEVSASRYFYSLEDGVVPLEFLFSGSVFYSNPDGLLQTTRIAWSQVRLRGSPRRPARRALRSWEEAIDSLLEEGGEASR